MSRETDNNDICCFIDFYGKKIEIDGIYSHIGIAEELLKRNQELMTSYESSGIHEKDDFLVKVGYMKLSKIGPYYKKVTFNSRAVSEKQRELIIELNRRGYQCSDVFLDLLRSSYDER